MPVIPDKNERFELFTSSKQPILSEAFRDFHRRIVKDENILDQIKQMSKTDKIILCTVGAFLVLLSVLSCCSTYSSYTQRKSLHMSHVELILARQATQRNRELA